MPRLSAEAMAGEYWREGPGTPPAPRHLSSEARALWRDIVASKGPGFFDPGSFPLLEQYCETAILQRQAFASLRADPSEENRRAVKDYGTLLNSTALKLRLAVSSRWRAHDGRLDEKRAPSKRRHLLGRVAVVPDGFPADAG